MCVSLHQCAFVCARTRVCVCVCVRVLPVQCMWYSSCACIEDGHVLFHETLLVNLVILKCSIDRKLLDMMIIIIIKLNRSDMQ